MKVQPKKNCRKFNEKVNRSAFIFVFVLPAIACFSFFYLYPLITVFVTSFSKWDYSNLPIPEMFGLQEIFTNYKYILTTYPFFYEALKNSLLWAVLCLTIQVPLSVIAALAFSRKLRGWKFSRNVFIIPNVISSAAIGMIFLQLYNPRYGIINPIIKLFEPGFNENIMLIPGMNIAFMTLAFVLFNGQNAILVLGNIMAVPEEIYEAARIDGASGFMCDIKITLPSIKEMIKTISIFAMTSGFLLYNEVYFLSKGAAGTKSISFVIRELAITSPRSQYGRANAVGVIQILIGLVLVVFINILFSLPYGKIFNKIRGVKNEKVR